jgi:hypothetical protein
MITNKLLGIVIARSASDVAIQLFCGFLDRHALFEGLAMTTRGRENTKPE